jgi:hypothetical protein
MQRRLDHEPENMRVRRQTVEHPFGTFKHWMGATHFLTKIFARVSTDTSKYRDESHVLAYNIKCVMKILGIGAVIEAIRFAAWNPTVRSSPAAPLPEPDLTQHGRKFLPFKQDLLGVCQHLGRGGSVRFQGV